MENECNMRGFTMAKGRFAVLMADGLLSTFMEWMNGEIILAEDGSTLLQKLYVAVPIIFSVFADYWPEYDQVFRFVETLRRPGSIAGAYAVGV